MLLEDYTDHELVKELCNRLQNESYIGADCIHIYIKKVAVTFRFKNNRIIRVQESNINNE